MNLHRYPYPFAYYNGRAIAFTRSDHHRFSYFGGPGTYRLEGLDHGPKPLHHIATVTTRDFDVTKTGFGQAIPFYYGLCYDGGTLAYQRSGHGKIEITAMSPAQSSEAWPYPNYPALLPYFPLAVADCWAMEADEFATYTMQGIMPKDKDTLLWVVPPNPLMGVSLWGPSGDAENVQIIFECDMAQGTVQAYNVCS